MPQLGTRNVDGNYTRSRERPNTFIPLLSCERCKDHITMLVNPTHWPVDSVAKVCYACGRVLEYIDNLLIFTNREAIVEYSTRFGGVIQDGMAKPVDVVDRDRILNCLELGFPIALIAADFNCSMEYVKQIARHAGIA